MPLHEPTPPPITFELDHALRARLATFRGRIADEALLGTYAAALADPAYDPTYHDLVDLSGVTDFAVTTDGVRQLAEGFQSTDALGLRTRLAIVAAHDELFGMGRMYEMLRAGAPEEIRVFRSRADAVAWLAAARRTGEEP